MQPIPPTAHTHTHTRPTPPGQQFSKLFWNGQKLEAIFLEIKAIVQHFGNLLCDPSNPTTPKRTCTFTTQWNNYATLPVSGFPGKCMAGTTLQPCIWVEWFQKNMFHAAIQHLLRRSQRLITVSFNRVVMMFSLLTKTHSLVYLNHTKKQGNNRGGTVPLCPVVYLRKQLCVSHVGMLSYYLAVWRMCRSQLVYESILE